MDGRGKTCWNVGYPFQEGLKTDDVDFLLKLSAKLCREKGFDRRNVFLTGMSNGGEMCYLMAYTHPDFFNAIAPIAGLTMEWMRKELKAKGPVPMMEVHGTQDHTSEWEGDPDNAGGWGSYISVPLAIGRWADEACRRGARQGAEQSHSPPLSRWCPGIRWWPGNRGQTL